MTQHTTSKTHAESEHGDVKNGMPDITGMLERFNLPGFDVASFVESRKQDIDAVTVATSTAFTGAQTIVDKQAEMLKAVLGEIGEALRKVPAGATMPNELIDRQQKLANEALSSALKSMKEIADTVSKSQSEIIDLAANRIRSSVEEIRRLAERSQKHETEAK